MRPSEDITITNRMLARARQTGRDQWWLFSQMILRRELFVPMLSIWVASFGSSLHDPVTTYFLMELGASTQQVGNFAAITTFGVLESTVAAAAPAFTPPNTVTADFNSMLASGYNSDIALYCGHRQFDAHRSILGTRSPYFKGLFASTMRDAAADGLPITDTEPDVFEQLLLWVYTGEVAEAALQAKDMLEHLLMAANRYECGGLKLLCEAKLCEGLSVENVATRLVLAEQAEADELKEACLELIKPNAAAVMGTEGWKDVASNNALVNEVLALVAGAPTADSGKGKKRTADEAGLSAQDAQFEDMREWKMARLREALHGRALSIEGRRPELVARLECAIQGDDGKEAGET